MPDWEEIDLTWEELSILPTRWRGKLAEWRAIYYIFDCAIGVGTFVPHNAVICPEDAVALMAKVMKERRITHTTSECTLHGFTCSQVKVDPKVATPAEIVGARNRHRPSGRRTHWRTRSEIEMRPARITAAGALAVCSVAIAAFSGSEAAQPPARERVVGHDAKTAKPYSSDFHHRCRQQPASHAKPSPETHCSSGGVCSIETAVAGVIVYAYQTDRGGIYRPDATLEGTAASQHSLLRGRVRTNKNGEYAFDTIRPGGYPNRTDPDHIHLYVIEPDRCTYYIGNVEFTDDPGMAPKYRDRQDILRGGSGVTTPSRDSKGVWQVTRDIRLRQNIPGYSSCASSR